MTSPREHLTSSILITARDRNLLFVAGGFVIACRTSRDGDRDSACYGK